jgi:hypothetical protein
MNIISKTYYGLVLVCYLHDNDNKIKKYYIISYHELIMLKI